MQNKQKQLNGQATDQGLENMFARQQVNHAMSVPKQAGIVSAADMQMVGVQATQNVIALTQQRNQQQVILQQNAMMAAQQVFAQMERMSNEGNDVEGEISFVIEGGSIGE